MGQFQAYRWIKKSCINHAWPVLYIYMYMYVHTLQNLASHYDLYVHGL